MRDTQSRWSSALLVMLYSALGASILWACGLGFPLYNRCYIFANRAGYSPERFIVARVEYNDGTHSEDGLETWIAHGQIERTAALERLSLHDWLKEPLHSQRELEALLPRGKIIAVLYNPSMSDMIVQGETPRVLVERNDVWKSEEAAIRSLALKAFLPFVLCAILVYLAHRHVASNSATDNEGFHDGGDY